MNVENTEFSADQMLWNKHMNRNDSTITEVFGLDLRTVQKQPNVVNTGDLLKSFGKFLIIHNDFMVICHDLVCLDDNFYFKDKIGTKPAFCFDLNRRLFIFSGVAA